MTRPLPKQCLTWTYRKTDWVVTVKKTAVTPAAVLLGMATGSPVFQVCGKTVRFHWTICHGDWRHGTMDLHPNVNPLCQITLKPLSWGQVRGIQSHTTLTHDIPHDCSTDLALIWPPSGPSTLSRISSRMWNDILLWYQTTSRTAHSNWTRTPLKKKIWKEISALVDLRTSLGSIRVCVKDQFLPPAPSSEPESIDYTTVSYPSLFQLNHPNVQRNIWLDQLDSFLNTWLSAVSLSAAQVTFSRNSIIYNMNRRCGLKSETEAWHAVSIIKRVSDLPLMSWYKISSQCVHAYKWTTATDVERYKKKLWNKKTPLFQATVP